MELEFEYASLNDVPEAHRPLYKEVEGKAVFSGVKGVKHQRDVDNLSEALRKERNDHATVRNSLKVWEGLDFADVKAKISEYDDLKAIADGKIDNTKLDQLVAPKLAQATAPLQRKVDELTTGLSAKDQEIAKLQQQIVSRDRNDLVKSVAAEMKVLPTAIADVELFASMVFEQDASGAFVTKAGLPGITPGQDMKAFLKDMQNTRPHWWPQSQGGGAGGGSGSRGGNNPFSHAHWNVGEQGKILRDQGRAAAEALAKEAGTTVGGLRPAAPKG